MDNLNNFGFFVLPYKEKNVMFYLHEDFGFYNDVVLEKCIYLYRIDYFKLPFLRRGCYVSMIDFVLSIIGIFLSFLTMSNNDK